MVETPKTLTTPQQAAEKLKQIRRWALLPWTPQTPLRSPRLDQTIRGTGSPGLPFPIDTVTEDGAQGINTPSGVAVLQELWAAWLSWLLNTPIKGDPGAWLLRQLEENQGLRGINIPPQQPDNPGASDMLTYTYALATYDEWAKFVRELNACWWRVATATGNAPQTRTTCPKCKTGTIQTQPTSAGFDDEAACTNPSCGLTIDYSKDEAAASFRSALRDPAITYDYWLTLKDLKTIWPGIKAATLRTRAHYGNLRTRGEGKQVEYNLDDINAWMQHKQH